MSDDQELPTATPVIKNKRGQPIKRSQKLMVVKLYNGRITKKPKITYKQLSKEISEKLGIGLTSVQRILSEYKNTKKVTTPKMTKVRSKLIDSIDDYDRNAIRQRVHSYWFNHELPTMKKFLTATAEDNCLPTIKRTIMYSLLKELKFVFTRTKENSVLTDSEDIIIWRRNYLRNITKYREENRTIYYLDEMWCNVFQDYTENESFPRPIKSETDRQSKVQTKSSNKKSTKGYGIILIHIGSNKGFVEGGQLCLESKTNSIDYHTEINGNDFLEWFSKILPLLDENSVIVMDNAPYHSAKVEKIPTSAWKKMEIIQWLVNKNIEIDSSLVKAELLQLVKSQTEQCNKYVIDEAAKEANKIVLRLPDYHSKLNAIELAWTMVKDYVIMHNTTFDINDVKQLLIDSINKITEKNWSDFVNQTICEENILWNIDNIMDEMIDNSDSLLFAEENSDSESDY